MPCRIVVGEAHDGYVVRYLEPVLLYRVEDGKGHYIVECQYGIRRIGRREHLVSGFDSILLAYLTAFHQGAVYRYPVFSECLQVTVLAPAYHIEVVRSSDERYPPASGVDEVLSGFLGGNVAVGSYL